MEDKRTTLETFIAKVKNDPDLQRELENDLEGVLARETGLTPADVYHLVTRQTTRDDVELADHELAQVAGGVAGSAWPCSQCPYIASSLDDLIWHQLEHAGTSHIG